MFASTGCHVGDPRCSAEKEVGCSFAYYRFYRWLDRKTRSATEGIAYASVAAVVCIGVIPTLFSLLVFFIFKEKLLALDGGAAVGLMLAPHAVAFIYLEICDVKRSRKK